MVKDSTMACSRVLVILLFFVFLNGIKTVGQHNFLFMSGLGYGALNTTIQSQVAYEISSTHQNQYPHYIYVSSEYFMNEKKNLFGIGIKGLAFQSFDPKAMFIVYDVNISFAKNKINEIGLKGKFSLGLGYNFNNRNSLHLTAKIFGTNSIDAQQTLAGLKTYATSYNDTRYLIMYCHRFIVNIPKRKESLRYRRRHITECTEL